MNISKDNFQEKKPNFFGGGVPHPGIAQCLFLALHLGNHSWCAWGPYKVLRIEPRFATCKACALSTCTITLAQEKNFLKKQSKTKQNCFLFKLFENW